MIDSTWRLDRIACAATRKRTWQPCWRCRHSARKQEPERLAEAAAIYQVAIERGQAEMFNPADFGFEFSKAQVEAELSRLNPELMRSFN
jgi:hypothetical protein